MKLTAFVLIAALVALALPMAMPAQEKKDSKEVSITGCFNKGEAAGSYVITDEKTNKKVMVTGDPAKLDRHANNHKVTLTGAMAKEKDKEVLKATDLKMLAMCQ